MPMIFIGLLVGFLVGAIFQLITYLLFQAPEPYKMPSIGSVDPGLQFTEQYNTRTSQVPVPIVFGQVKVTGNIIYENIGGPQNDRLYSCMGICEQMTLSSIDTLWVDDMEWSTLPTVVKSASSYTYYPNGGASSFVLDSSGSHGFGFTLESAPKEEVTYPITIYGDGSSVLIRQLLYKGYEQINVGWRVWYKEVDDVGWTLVATHGGYWWWTYNGEIVPHTWQYEESVSLNAGKYIFKLEMYMMEATEHAVQEDDEGNDTWSFSSLVRFDEVIVQDEGELESFNFYETAYVKIELKRDAALPANTVIQTLVTGVYSNPAECIKMFLTNSYWGLGLDPDIICSTCYTAAYNFCATYGYTYNRCIGTRMNTREILTEMCLAGRLLLLDYEGQIHIVPDQDSAAVKTITDDDIMDLQYARPSITQAPTRLVAKFNDADEEYTVQDIIVDDVMQQDFRGVVKETTINLTGVTSRNIANQLAMFYMNKITIDEVVVLKLSINHSDLKPADIINLTSVDAGWIAKPLRIVSIEEDADMDVTLTCQPHYAGMYDIKPYSQYTGDQRKVFYNPPSTLYPQKLPNATGALISDEQYNVGDIISCDLIITFQKPSVNCDYCEIWLSRGTWGVNNPNPYKMIGTSNGEFRYRVEEYFTQHMFRIVTVYGGNKNKVAESPMVMKSPAPMTTPGYGAGNYGVQWYGY